MKTTTIKQEVFINASPDQVYECLIDPRKHAAFTGSRATCDPRPGGKFSAWDGYIFGKNLKLEKGKRIYQEWQTTEWPEGAEPSIIEFRFKPFKGGTKIVMVQSEVPAEQKEEYAQGWIDFYWAPLKAYFVGKRG